MPGCAHRVLSDRSDGGFRLYTGGDVEQRRAALERQIAMADEFLGLLADELG